MAMVIVAILMAVGIARFDVPVLMFLRQFDGVFWRVAGAIFDDKVWAACFFVAVALVYVQNTIKTKSNPWNLIKRFKIGGVLRDFWLKTKNSHAFLIFCSIFVTGVIVQVVKVFIGRARPILFEQVDVRGFFPPSFYWEYNSMPSGHTAISFAALVMIGMLYPRAKVFTWSLAILIGVSRICVGAHWPTDVILGAFIGMLVADFTKAFIMRMRKSHA